ncbi:ROK family protein [Geoalkalibacter sp.]|uniref:ROK family protein n=1 Tax=Geoalkalibacter sp. TaxID=3041440 RepID=UPI00272DCA47|nr:ROK family protein [Geoalkalibacter sp.]
MDRELLIGIDLGGTNCRLALVDGQGQIGAGARLSSREFQDAEALLARLVLECRALVEQVRLRGAKVKAVGAGVPGLVDGAGRVIVAPNLGILDGLAFAAELERRLGLPVAALNDANASAWGERIWGAGQDLDASLTLTLGTGVGGGIILDGRLWAGPDGCAGEVGHLNVEPEGRPCGCGSRGCLEQYSSATGILLSVREALGQGRASVLAQLEGAALTAAAVGEAARQGDGLALEVLGEAGRRLGQVLAAVVNLLDLDGAVICGGVASSLDLLLPALRRELFARAFARPAQRLRIVAGALGDNAGILGAAHFACHPLAAWKMSKG